MPKVGISSGMSLSGTLEMVAHMTFYLRAQIDDHQLTHGGQRFTILYTNTDGDEVSAGTAYVHGKDDPAGDEEKYYYCGPFEMVNWNDTEPVRISLYYGKNVGYMDPIESNRTIGGQDYRQLNYMFDYFIEDDDGTLKVQLRKEAKVEDWVQFWRGVCGVGGIYRKIYKHVRGLVRITSLWPSVTPDTWPHLEQNHGNAVWDFDQRYNRVSSMYEDIPGAAFRALLDNRETRIYNWGTAEYKDDPRVVVYNFEFDLRAVHIERPKPIAPAGQPRHFPVDDPEYIDEKQVGVTPLNLLGLDPDLLFEVIFWENATHPVSDYFDDLMNAAADNQGKWFELFALPGGTMLSVQNVTFQNYIPPRCANDNRYSIGPPQTLNGETLHNWQTDFDDAKVLWHVLDAVNGTPNNISYTPELYRGFVDGCQIDMGPGCDDPHPEQIYPIADRNLNFNIRSIDLEEPYY